MRESDAPCRLFVYLAREAPTGVVLRRGPSDWVRMSIWHTDTDRFEHGQWLKGRVYERRCDVSADGSLFVAFVRQDGGKGSADSWVAVSRPPWFTALAVWLVGGTWHTGGFFPDRWSLWVGFSDGAPDIGTVPAWLRRTPPRAIPYIDGTAEWTDRTVHFNRLLRDGWRLTENEASRTTWERFMPTTEARALLMTQQVENFGTYGGLYAVDYALRKADGSVRPLGRATWADWDQRGRLVLARAGRLFGGSGVDELELIEDFNDQKPDPQPAPAWARDWPSPTSS